MKNVDLTIVGFFDELNHASLTVPGNRPTVKSALEAMCTQCLTSDEFSFVEYKDMKNRAPYKFMPMEKNFIISIKYRGFKLSADGNVLSPYETKSWRFSVLRRSGARKVLLQNVRGLPFDQFRIEDGDQIFWCLVTSLKRPVAMSLGLTDYEKDALIAV